MNDGSHSGEKRINNEWEKLEDEINDPVIDEYEVYTNRLIADPETGKSALIYLLQYPLRPVYRPYGDHGQLCSIEKGNTTNKLRLKYSLNVEGNEYNESKRRLLEAFLERKEAKKPLDEEEEIQLDAMRFSRLVSTEAKNQGQCEYGLAFRKDKRVYITPVSQLLQFRPDFSHQDAMDELKARRGVDHRENQKSTQAELGENDSNIDETNNGDVTPTTGSRSSTTESRTSKRITPESTNSLDMSSVNNRIKLSHAECRKKELSEQYTPIDTFYDADSPEGAELLTLLSTFPVKYAVEVTEDVMESRINDLFDLTGTSGGSASHGNASGGPKYDIRTKRVVQSSRIPDVICEPSYEKYLEALCKDCALSTLAGTTQLKETSTATSFGPTGVGTGPLSYLALSKLSLDNQIRRILRIREMERYEEIRALVTTSNNISDDQFIEILLKYAVPIHGNWVVRSEILWEEKPEDRSYKLEFVKSKWTEIEMLTRDLVLCFYAVGVELAKPTILKSTGCPPDRLSRIIKTIYVIKDGKYKPRLSPDNSFKENFQTLCREQELLWGRERVADIKTKCEQLKAHLSNVGGAGSGSLGGGKDVDGVLDLLDRIRVKTCVESILTREGASTEPFILSKVKTTLLGLIEQDMKTTLAASMSTMGSGASATAQLLDHHNKLKSAVAALEEIHLKEILIDCATEFRKLWILQRHRNRQLDEYRQVLLNMYRQNSEKGITKSDFKEECLKIFRKPFDLPDMQYRSLMKEIAVNQEGYWYYKGSDVVQDSNEKHDNGL